MKNRFFIVITGILCFIIAAHGVHGNLQCMVCIEALDVKNCLTKAVTCGTGEQCFLEKITRSSDGKTVYNGGCRSSAVCRAAALLGKKKRDTLQCTECCNTAPDSIGPCNSKLCGVRPLKSNPTCLDCSVKASAAACLTRTICTITQVCGNEIIVVGGSLVRYNFYCEERHLCAAAYNALGKGKREFTKRGSRSSNYGHAYVPGSTVICNSCCIGDECNQADCYALQNNFTDTDFRPVTTLPSG